MQLWPALVEGAEHQALDHGIEAVALVGVDEAGRVAPEFEDHFLAAGLGLEFPAHGGRAGETQQLQPIVVREEIGAVAMCGQDRERALRQIGFRQRLAHDERADGRARGGFHYPGAARGDGGRDLVRGEIEREVERRDQRARPDRHALPHAAIAFRARRDFEVDHLAADAHRFLGADAESVDQPRGLAARVADRLAGLDAQGQRDFFGALGEALDAMVEHFLPLVGRKGGHRLLRLHRGRDAGVDGFRIGQRYARGDLAGELVGDFQVGVGEHWFTGEVVGIAILEHVRFLQIFALSSLISRLRMRSLSE